MKLRTRFLSRSLAVAVVLVLFGVVLNAQSLGELARQARAKKAQQPPASPNRVYTNDNLPKMGGLSTSEAPPTDAKAKPGEKGKEGEKEAPKAGEAAKPGAEAEAEARARFAKLRDALSTEERRLDVMQRELNLANVQFYSDPNKAMNEQQTRAEINKRTEEIDKQKAAVDAAKKAIADAEEDLRKKGLPPGWARE